MYMGMYVWVPVNLYNFAAGKGFDFCPKLFL